MGKPTQQHAVANILTGKWLESLTFAIESHRSAAPALAECTLSSEQLALIVAHVVTRPRKNDKLPSPLTVARDVGFTISGTYSDSARRIGFELLNMARHCGFVAVPDGERKPGWQAAKVIRLSAAAEQERAQLETRLAASDVPVARPLPECPPVVAVPGRNKDDCDPSPLPEGLAVAEALAPIQRTAWRVNQFMLETLRRLNPPDEIAALAQAEQFHGAPFYYRCGFDWRGRIYQHGGRLQYTGGSDAARALLEFAHGERLTPDGYTWLGVHVATCYGVKGSLTDRRVWTDGAEALIAQAVADPIGSTWWRSAAQPYRFLAACHAWVNCREPVHLPVAADATASGVQHLAWLLRDEKLAAKVNLARGAVSERPRDFYGELAQLRTGGYSRKEVKAQWVFYGKKPDRNAPRIANAREHAIQRLLKQAAPEAWKLYLALRRLAKREAEAGMPLEWTLPDGFRVRQAYRESVSNQVETAAHVWSEAAGRRTVAVKEWRYRETELLASLDIKKQARGLPPNLIHSLDACLLRAIVREADAVNRWAVARDSLGVHPNDGEALRLAIVEAVECVYGPDVLASLGWDLQGVEHAAELPASMRGGWYTFS